MLKTKEEYLAMIPPYLSREVWEHNVNRAFSPDCWQSWGEDEKEKYLERLFQIKPVSLVDRWRMDAEIYEKEAKQVIGRFKHE